MKKIFSIFILSIIIIQLSGCTPKEATKPRENIKNIDNNNLDDTQTINENFIHNFELAKKIIIYDSFKNETLKEIIEEDAIIEINKMFLRGNKSDGIVTTEGNRYNLSLYSGDNILLCSIKLWENGYYGYQSKEFILNHEDNKALFEIIL